MFVECIKFSRSSIHHLENKWELTYFSFLKAAIFSTCFVSSQDNAAAVHVGKELIKSLPSRNCCRWGGGEWEVSNYDYRLQGWQVKTEDTTFGQPKCAYGVCYGQG
jgi:hypothetical protein